MFDLLWLSDDLVVNKIPSMDELFIQDLDIDSLANNMFEGMQSKLNANQLCNLFAIDKSIVLERQNILKDLMKYPDLRNLFQQILDTILKWQEFFSIPNMDENASDLEAFFALGNYGFGETYIKIINTCYDVLVKYETTCSSDGIRQLLGYIREVHDSKNFANLTSAWYERLSCLDDPKSLKLGFNLNDTFEITQVKFLSVNDYTYIEEGDRPPKNGDAYVEGLTGYYKLKDDASNKSGFTVTNAGQAFNDKNSSATHASEPVRMTNFVRSALGVCVGDSNLRVRDLLKQNTRWILNLKTSLTFYMGALNLATKIQELDSPFVFPTITDDKCFVADSIYLPMLLLVLKGSRPVIPNTISFAPEGEFGILTGANQGGKTTFLRSVAVGQFMGQLGMPVGAKSLTMGMVDNIFTIFALKEEVTTSKKGKFAQEIARVGEMLNKITTNSMIVFNEPLTGTGTAETIVITREITCTCKLLGARGIWVTHLHQIAADIPRLNKLLEGSRLKSLVARVKQLEVGTMPTYHVEEAEPEMTSHAYDVVRRFGLDLN